VKKSVYGGGRRCGEDFTIPQWNRNNFLIVIRYGAAMHSVRWQKAETEVKGGLAMANRQNPERLCVMIVEHDVDFGFKLADWLAAHGYQAVLVRSIDEAIEELREIRPQAVFVGRGFSEPAAQIGMSEILLLIQTLCPRVPMVTIADQAGESLTQVVFRQGVRHFLVRPVEFAQVNHVLQSELSSSAQLWVGPVHSNRPAIDG
jgi:ActR/RegA family two-component response regulator